MRSKVLIRAHVRGGGAARDSEACVLDVSPHGMLATMAHPPARGAFIELIAGGTSFVGHVEWSSARRFGLTLQDRIDVATLTTAARPAAPRIASHQPEPLPAQITGNRLQFMAMVAAGFIGALIVAHTVGAQLSVLQVAARAMAAARP